MIGEGERGMTEQRHQFGFEPDWRAQVPFWMILPRVALFVGLPVWLAWKVWAAMGLIGIRALFVIGLLMIAGARQVMVYARRTVRYQRRLRRGSVSAGPDGLRVLPPYGDWRTFPWEEVTELRVMRAAGLPGDGEMIVEAGGVRCTIPSYVERRGELERLIRFRAGLTEERRGWLASVYRRR